MVYVTRESLAVYHGYHPQNHNHALDRFAVSTYNSVRVKQPVTQTLNVMRRDQLSDNTSQYLVGSGGRRTHDTISTRFSHIYLYHACKTLKILMMRVITVSSLVRIFYQE